ncbi:hypothetical protein DB346_08925 [Verrucomicrobia bacterium LW23]|nr:hypothetical protein DB346_08925 [Verrucomicrobia bacterium LW23]
MKGFKFFLALILLPLIAAQMWALADLFAAWLPAGHWRAAPSICVALGFAAWVIIYFAFPHPLWIYVLSHELTHALAVYISGGKVYAIQVASTGGHVASDRVNWWISLSPYFVPLYTLILTGLWYSVDFYYPLSRYLLFLCFGFGFTFAFHVTYTISMLHKDQKDLISQGFFFSSVVILGMNLLVVTLFFIPVARNGNVSWTYAASQLVTRAGQCYSAPVLAAMKAQQRAMTVQSPLPWTPPEESVAARGDSGSEARGRVKSTVAQLRTGPRGDGQGAGAGEGKADRRVRPRSSESTASISREKEKARERERRVARAGSGSGPGEKRVASKASATTSREKEKPPRRGTGGHGGTDGDTIPGAPRAIAVDDASPPARLRPATAGTDRSIPPRKAPGFPATLPVGLIGGPSGT